jgi:hypothetical protein
LQAILGDIKFWHTVEVLLQMLLPIVTTLRTFESDGWDQATPAREGREILLSSVMPALTNMRRKIDDATPTEWKTSTQAACLATFTKAITDAHVCVVAEL